MTVIELNCIVCEKPLGSARVFVAGEGPYHPACIPTQPTPEMLDLHAPDTVEIMIAANGRVWVNVDGACRFRACRVKVINVIDENQRCVYRQKEVAG